MAQVTKIMVRDSDGRAEHMHTMEAPWVAPAEWSEDLAGGYSSVDPPGGELKALSPEGQYLWTIVGGAWVAIPDPENHPVRGGWTKDERNAARCDRITYIRAGRSQFTSAYYTGHTNPTIVAYGAAQVAKIDAEVAALEGEME